MSERRNIVSKSAVLKSGSQAGALQILAPSFRYPLMSGGASTSRPPFNFSSGRGKRGNAWNSVGANWLLPSEL